MSWTPFNNPSRISDPHGPDSNHVHTLTSPTHSTHSTHSHTFPPQYIQAASPPHHLHLDSTAKMKRNPNSPKTPKPRVSRISHLEPNNGPSFPVNYPIHPMPDISTIPIQHVPLLPLPGTIVMKRYATSVDQRNFLTVYEYMVNNQWIIWDYFTGYVHLTGLWKAVGNSKADIVRLVDNSPDLEPVIRRVRGGFLKIQGTWLPYPVARTLAARTCYHIRFALIPIFGADFPDTCLQPHQPGFGQLQLTTTENTRKRRKRSSVSSITFNESSPAPSSPAPQKRRQSELLPTRPFGMDHTYSSYSTSGNANPTTSTSNFTPNISSTSKPGPLRHRHSKSIGSIDMSKFNHNIVPRLEMNRPSSFRILNQAAIESSSDEEEDDDDYEAHLAKRARHNHSHRYILPPPMPVKLVFPDESQLVEFPDEFLAVLQATRSLQQLSAGKAGRRWSVNAAATTSANTNQTSTTQGESFECGGKLWKWDGAQNLTSTGPVPDRRYSHGDEPIRDHHRADVMNINGLIS